MDKKEIDLRVAQEIKNNKDFIYETNQMLQTLSNNLVQLQKTLEMACAQQKSDLKSLEIKFENLEEKLHAKHTFCYQTLEQYRHANLDAKDAIERKSEYFENNFVKKDEFQSLTESSKSNIQALFDEIKKMKDNFNHALDKQLMIFTIHINAVKEELLNLPTEIPELKKLIAEKIQVFEVNFQGLVKEIEVLKYSQFVSEKHIEDLYTKFKAVKS